ncbi:uncharacterized protein LOC142656684 [Rhinoderma darwinii]|uniref:uncharacterized protein LOC142656684 n=1 Tax=Rhinoderma darwinii TaxID=43563 RepID=UPI003F6642FB
MAQGIRERINQFTTGNVPGYERVVVQLFGMLGHGKSSLINSCLCVVKDSEYHNLAGAGKSHGSMTTKRQEHKLTNVLVMVDNRGIQKWKCEETAEVCAQLCSLRDIGEVTWDKDNLEETSKQLLHKYTNRPSDFILPVLVYSAITTLTNDDVYTMEKCITNSFKITGIHPIVVITKCTWSNVEEIKMKFGNLGVLKKIFLENYTENNCERTAQKDQKILDFVNMCVEEAERVLRLRQNEDPQMKFITQATHQIKLETDILREDKNKLKLQTDVLTKEKNKLEREADILKEEKIKLERENAALMEKNKKWCRLM